MKKLSLFELQHCTRAIVDDYFIENNYKILQVDTDNTMSFTVVTYKLQSSVINCISCFFSNDNGHLVKITFPNNL